MAQLTNPNTGPDRVEVESLISSYAEAKKERSALIRWKDRAWAVGATHDVAATRLELQCAEMIGHLRVIRDNLRKR